MRRILNIVVLMVLVGCNSVDKWEGIEVNKYLSLGDRRGVFICNEGNFMFGNASLTFYDKDESEPFNDIFYNTNGFPLGDVCQSMTIYDGKGFVVMNNSGKVYVIDIDNASYIGAIKGLVSPRYVEIISPTKAYVTDMYSPSIAIFNPQTLKVTGYIFVGYNSQYAGLVNGTEEMVRSGDEVYTCSWSYNNKIYKIDSKNDKLIDSAVVVKQPNSIVLDKNNKLWVLSDGGRSGSPYGQVNGALSRLDAKTLKTEAIFTFDDISSSPSRLTINKSGDTLYFINGDDKGSDKKTYGVYKLPISANTLPSVPFIENEERLIYALGVDPENEDIYISDAIDHTQSSIIYRYNSYGVLIHSFKSGITTGSFTFK